MTNGEGSANDVGVRVLDHTLYFVYIKKIGFKNKEVSVTNYGKIFALKLII